MKRHLIAAALFLTASLTFAVAQPADNPPVTDCNCPPGKVVFHQLVPAAIPLEENEAGELVAKPDINGTITLQASLDPSSSTGTRTLRIEDHNGENVGATSTFPHTFPPISPNRYKFPLRLVTVIACAGSGSADEKICDTKYLTLGGCESGNCSSGNCQSGSGDPSGDVDPTDENPFGLELPIGMSSQGDEKTSLYFSKSPTSPIAIGDFKVYSNGGYTHAGNVITTGTTVTTISAGGGGVTVQIKRAGTNDIFRTYQFNSVTTGTTKTLTLVETRCDQNPITHVWSHDSTTGLYSFSRANGLRKITKSIEQDVNFVKILRFKTYELVSGNDVLVSDESLHYQTFAWGIRMVQRNIDPDTANLTTTWTYGGYSDGLAYGKLKTLTRHDGYTETHTYGTNFHQVDSSGNRQEKTTWGGGTTTYETRTNGTLHEKEVEIISGNTITRNRYASSSTYLQTVTTYMPTGSDFGGLPSNITRPDGTESKYTYARTGGNRLTTVSEGKFVSNSLTDGTVTVTTVNAQGQTIESKTTDKPSNLVIAHTKALVLDDFGRPTTVGHFPNAQNVPVYSELRTYTCCKLTSETDIHGVTTLSQFDLLGRRTHTQTHGVVQETAYKGLTRTTHRYSSTSSASTTNRIAESVVTKLAGTIQESWEPDTSSGTNGALVKTTTTTTFQPAAGLSRQVVTTVPGNHSQTSTYLLDGRIKKSTGTLSPEMEYSFKYTSYGNLYAARAFLDGTTHREITVTRTDWLGRTTATGRLATLTSLTLIDPTLPTYGAGTGLHLTTTDPDGVAMRYEYNARGEREITVLELNGNTATDYGVDQVTRTRTFPANSTATPTVPVIRTEVHVWQDGAGVNSPTLASYSERTPDGLLSWSWQIGGQVARTESTVGLARTEKSINPDGAYSLATYHSGLMDRTETYSSANVLITSVSVRDQTDTPLSGYDSQRRATHRKDSRTGISVTSYLSATADVIASTTDPGNRTTAFTYDNRGRQLTVALPDNTATHTSYTPRGETEARWGSQTYPEFRTYDYAGRAKTLRTKPDLNQNVPVNTGGSLTTWNYLNDTGQLREKLDHSNKGPEYTYTAAGRLLTRDWARTLPSSATRVRTTYAYTTGRLTGVTYNDGTPNLVYTHDNLARIKTVTRAGNNHAEYLYDTTTLRLVTEKLNRDIEERHLHRHYDTYGRPLSLNLATTTGSSEYTAAYGYDNASRLDRVWHHPTLSGGVPQGNPTFTYGYTYTQPTPTDLRSGATGGAQQDFMPYTLTRNAAGADPALTATRSYSGTRDTLHSIENKAGTSLVSSYIYNVNSMGQRENVTTAGSAFSASAPADWSWQYDTLGQLTLADSPTAARDRAYEFDPIGNRKKFAHGTLTLPGSDNYTANALNQYSVVPDYTPQPVHDLDGNLTRGPVPGSPGAGHAPPVDATEIKWDAENRLISCKLGTVTCHYAYDHLSRQVARGVTTNLDRRYFYDGWNRIAENFQGAAYSTFTWGLDLSGTMRGAGGVGGLLATRWVSEAGQPDYFPAYDGNGNVTEYLTTAGVVEVHWEYDPFGGLTRRTGNTASRFQYRYSTKPRDFNTGLYDYGYRLYNTYTGNWPSRDPIEEEGGVNLYGFVGNDGVNKWDYNGLLVIAKLTHKNYGNTSKRTTHYSINLVFRYKICVCVDQTNTQLAGADEENVAGAIEKVAASLKGFEHKQLAYDRGASNKWKAHVGTLKIWPDYIGEKNGKCASVEEEEKSAVQNKHNVIFVYPAGTGEAHAYGNHMEAMKIDERLHGSFQNELGHMIGYKHPHDNDMAHTTPKPFQNDIMVQEDESLDGIVTHHGSESHHFYMHAIYSYLRGYEAESYYGKILLNEDVIFTNDK